MYTTTNKAGIHPKVRIFPITDKKIKKNIIVYVIAKQNEKRRYRIVDFKLDENILTLSECHKQRVPFLQNIYSIFNECNFSRIK